MSVALEVEASVCGRRWRARPCDEAVALAIAQRLVLPDIAARVLAARGLDPDSAPGFIEPRVGALLPDPSHLHDLDRAVERLADAIAAGQVIGLLGDYDVDGATSVAVLARYLGAVGARSAIDIPDRLREGYGPNPAALERLAAKGCKLVVVLDAGTTAFEALAAAAARGLAVVVIDHHAAEARLPEALAVVNPNRRDQASPLGDLAAVGVTFLLVVGLNRALRARGLFSKRAEPDVRHWLDLVALGTLCDVVPLAGLNRAFVVQGLKVAARGLNPGLVALAGAAGIEGPLRVDDCGFGLGPRINAGGRVGRSELGAHLLTTDDAAETAALALELDRLNRERRTLERQVSAAAAAAVAPAVTRGAPMLVAAGEGWSPGVVGLAAARLVERHHRPAVVIGLDGATGQGSGRSVPEFDLGGAVIAARQEGLLLKGGGHPMAAGLTVERDRIEALERFLCGRLPATLAGGPRPRDLLLDGAAQVRGLSYELAAILERLGPFGRANPEPRLLVKDARIWQVRRVGECHIDCALADAAGGRARAIAFRAADNPLGQALQRAEGGLLHLAGRLKRELWQGQWRVSFQIEDAAPV